jgi:hypothetical protein
LTRASFPCARALAVKHNCFGYPAEAHCGEMLAVDFSTGSDSFVGKQT